MASEIPHCSSAHILNTNQQRNIEEKQNTDLDSTDSDSVTSEYSTKSEKNKDVGIGIFSKLPNKLSKCKLLINIHTDRKI